ncbi:MAG: ATPase, T2SS/T4P/T4SS family, partial [Acetanaerobacterium sp.]
DLFHTVAGETPYATVLSGTQEYISRVHQAILNKDTLTPEDVLTLKKYIENYLMTNDVKCRGVKSMVELVDKLYKDMALYSFLTDYLDERKIDELGLEEININSWDCVFLKTAKKGKLRLEERFLSPQHAIDVVKRMLRHKDMTIDDTMPVALGTLGKNVRIAAMKTPVLDKEIGISASIRIVSFSKLGREDLLKYGTATPEMLDLLELFLRHKVSICLAGETGSGKTGTAGYLLSEVTRDDTLRVITVEEGSREFSLVRRDENGYPVNDVVHLITVPSSKKEYNIDQDFLLERLLRYDPDIIGVGEMRSKESFTAAETSLTSHTVVTTIHADSAEDTYERMVVLAKKMHEFQDATLYRLMVKAFPIIAFQKVLADGSRKITQIIEAEGLDGTQVKYRTLYRYKVENNFTDELGSVTTTGCFERVEKISGRLRERLIARGVARAVAERM